MRDNVNNVRSVYPTPVYKYTMAEAADATCSGRSASTWYQGDISTEKFDFTSSNLNGGSIEYYRYIWDRAPATAVTGGSTQWSSGTLSLTPANSKAMYLHVVPYNGDDVPVTQVDYGPYYFVDTSRLLKGGKFFDDDGNLIEMGPK